MCMCTCATFIFSAGICVSARVCIFMCTHLNSRYACVCPCLWSFLSLQTLTVAKIQVAWLIKDTLEVPLTPSTKVAHVLRQFTGRLSPGLQGQEGNEDKDSLLPR